MNQDKERPSELDFSRAQFEETSSPKSEATLECRACSSVISDQYYTLNQHPLCSTCRSGLQGRQSPANGDTFLALAWGTGAAAFGAGLYYLIAELWAEFGLVALAVGIMVGKAVRRGAGLSSHWRFRAIAVALTYLAIVATYVPSIIQRMGASATDPDALLSALSVALITPVLFVEIQNWIGLIILGIAIWEAYRYSAGAPFTIEGPFAVDSRKGATSQPE